MTKLKDGMGRVLLATLMIAGPLAGAQTPATNSVIPTLVNFSGTLTDVNGKAVSGIAGVTFYLYKDAEGGAPLWLETQNVQPDRFGRYSVVLGATKAGGVPAELFASGEARWLGVQPQGQSEQPRVMLLAVPYALKAGDAQTVGGLPASAFVLAAPGPSGSGDAPNDQPPVVNKTAVVSGSGTSDFIPLWTSSTVLSNSILFQSSGSPASIGINTTTPAATLDVNGGVIARGALQLPSTGTANSGSGFNSQPFSLQGSSFNSGTSKAVSQLFQWQTEPTGNDTGNPSGTLNLLFGANGAVPAETGLTIDHTGLFTFAKGQTFPGTGTLTGITTGSGSGLIGGGSSGTLNLSLTNTCTANQVLQWSGSAWVCATASGGGTITGVTAGTDLTGGGTSGNVTLNLDTTKVPQLNVSNTFTGMQTITVNGGSEALNVTQQAASGQTYGIIGTNFSTGNRSAAVLGQSLAGSGIVFGVEGYIADNDGAGVFGADGNPLSQTGGSLSGTFGSGVWGDGSSAGLGMIATTDNNSALEAVNNSGASATIFAENRSPASTQLSTAVTGIAFGSTAMSVLGSGPTESNTFDYEVIHDGIPRGVGGDSISGVGVAGFSDIGTAVKGLSEYSGTGVSGVSQTGIGVFGASQTAAGVSGISVATDNAGVYGETLNTNGPGYAVWGDDPTGNADNSAVLGTTSLGYGVLGISGAGEGVYGEVTGASANGTAGYFSATGGGYPFVAAGPIGSCAIDGAGDLFCTGSTSAMVPLPDNRSVALYAMQSPEQWFEDFGSGQLVNGAAEISLDPTFAQTINTHEYRVFPVANGDCKGLYVAQKTATGFVVRELGGGKSNIDFDYRIVARRQDHEQARFKDVSELRARQEARAQRAPQTPHRPELIAPKANQASGGAMQLPLPMLPHAAAPLQRNRAIAPVIPKR